MNINPFFSFPLLGIDVQPEGIICARLRKKRGGCYLERAITMTLPAGIFAEGKIMNWDKFQPCLVEFVAEHGLYGSKVAICVPSKVVRMHDIKLPVGLGESDIEAEINLHLQRDLPGMLDSLRLDYKVIDERDNYLQVFFTAVREEYLNKYTACYQAAGLKIKVIDVDVLALKRAIRMVLPENAAEVKSVLHSFSEKSWLLAFGLAMRDDPPW